MRHRIEEILIVLDNATTIEEADIPGYRLHSLTGNLRGYWSVRVTGNWRIIFRFEEGFAEDVDLVDYHYGERLVLIDTAIGVITCR